MTEFAEWDSFYVILGSAAGALIGLQFVVMTLFSAAPQRPTAEAGAAFATPTILDFASTLGIALVMRVPWPSPTPAAICFGVAGLAGIVYSAIVTRRIRFQSSYEPELEDWIFYVAMRLLAFLILALSGLFALSHTTASLFGVAVAGAILLFSGIHNAWDAVSFHIFVTREKTPSD
jgi:hypothetical protein